MSCAIKSRTLPSKFAPGIEEPIVSDDFGFVYGFLLALTGDGFSDRELEFYADSLKKELSLVEGVTRVESRGVQPQAIYVDVSDQNLNQLGISAATVVDTLSQQNIVVESRHERFAPGDMVFCSSGWQDYCLLKPDEVPMYAPEVFPRG